MTPQQVALVQNSWRLLRDVDPQKIGDLFYGKLFLDHPEVRRMFPKDMGDQHLKLIAKFNVIVARLDRLGEIKDEIAALARRHVEYGVVPKQYAYVGDALLWTLERGLGDDWTPAVANAWKACYTLLSAAMLESLD